MTARPNTATCSRWQKHAASLWTDNWVVGRKTENTIRRLSRWDADTQTYVPPRFVSKKDYDAARLAFFEQEVERLSVTDTEKGLNSLHEQITNLEEKLRESVKSEKYMFLEREALRAKLEDVSYAQKVSKPRLEQALTYVRMGKQDAKYLLEAEYILEILLGQR